MKLTKVLFLLLASVSMLASSCSDDDDEDNGTTKDCVPTLVTTTQDGVTSESTLGYNSDRRISSVMMEEESLEGTVAYSNGKPSKFTVTNSVLGPGYIEYTHNNAGQLSQMNIFSSLFPGAAAIRFVFDYNSAGQVSKISNFQSNPFTGTGLTQEGSSTFTYDGKGNIVKESQYTGTGTSTDDLDYTIEYTYDTYENPANELEKLIRGVSSPNNILTAITKDASGTVTRDESFTRVYKYNSDNFPTEYTQTTQSGIVSTSKVTYDCQ